MDDEAPWSNGMGSRYMPFEWNNNTFRKSWPFQAFSVWSSVWETMTPQRIRIWMMKPLAQMAWAVGTCHLNGIAMPFAKADHFRPCSVWLSVGKTMTHQRIQVSMMNPLAWMALEVGTCHLTGTSMPWGTTYPPTCWATASSGHCLFILALGQWESMNDHKTTPTTDDGNRWIMALVYSRNAKTSSEVCHLMNQTTTASTRYAFCFQVMSTVLVIVHRSVVKHNMRITNISDTWYGLLYLFFLT